MELRANRCFPVDSGLRFRLVLFRVPNIQAALKQIAPIESVSGGPFRACRAQPSVTRTVSLRPLFLVLGVGRLRSINKPLRSRCEIALLLHFLDRLLRREFSEFEFMAENGFVCAAG